MESTTYSVGEEIVTVEPQFELPDVEDESMLEDAEDSQLDTSALSFQPPPRSLSCSFSIEPPLPDGLSFDPKTGAISGTPTAVTEETSHVITASNASGSSTTTLVLQVMETVEVDEVDTAFITKIEAVTCVEELQAVDEPSSVKFPGDWMVWMVHRAHLNDPSLTDFNFNNMHMPPPHMEVRIAPKLMEAMATNTHIETLSLSNSNLNKSQGPALAQSLRKNTTLRILNLESNCLDSAAVKAIAEAIGENRESGVECLRVEQQKQVGRFFGRPVEEAFGQMMQQNQMIIKLGFHCDDHHWRNIIDRALLRNNDIARRRRRRSRRSKSADSEEEVPAEDLRFGRLMLRVPPSGTAQAVFAQDSPQVAVFRQFVAKFKKLPTPTQLQNYAKQAGSTIAYKELNPLIKDSRLRLLEAATNSGVTVADLFEVEIEGQLRGYSLGANEKWTLDLWTEAGKRYCCKSEKEPVLSISDEWGAWLEAEA
eukprot:gnl/TRDRNA2_/TRDRNA2_135381_c0_seq1.p2 gnl/TRDRNA2_/TRDRNA2_135381_c0~~gnl/TRDRNA2_/TRDRNA2_135381_c0_seq1.p2  ORF type:complete len:481 (-),score=107.90 gnl/TRDRNA2_/TRDRNA2_135381_c0_seq1:182-1624(-)